MLLVRATTLAGGSSEMQGVATYSAALIKRNLTAGRGARPAFVDDCGH